MRFIEFLHRSVLRMDAYAWQAISDILIDLAAGWYGAAVISFPLIQLISFDAFIRLATHIAFGTISLVFGIKIRRAFP